MKCLIQTGLFVCIILCLLNIQAIADVELLNDNELKKITGQSGFSVAPFPGFEVEIDEDEKEPCRNKEDCEEKKEEENGSSFSFKMPQDGFTPSGILPSGNLIMNLTLPIPAAFKIPVMPAMQIAETIPMDILNSMPMSFGGLF